ncbi:MULTISPECIES: transposase [unclassified Streptomyces]|nr:MULTISPECIES: transposase [unclassified Streptomyces]
MLGRPSVCRRRSIAGIRWRGVRTRSPCRDLSPEYGRWQTV